MKKWVKQAALVAAGLGLAASSVLAPLAVSAESKIGKQPGVAAIQVNQPLLQKKLEQTEKSALSDDTLIIKFKKPLTQTEHQIAGGILIKQFSELNYAVVKVKDKKNLHKTIKKYKDFSQVVSVNPSAFYKPLSIKDPKISEQYQIDLLHLEKAQQLAGKNPVTVAVIDQGIDGNHPDLKGRLLPGYNAVNPMNQGTPDFHGTHVAGIIAANKNNGIGGYGVNPHAKILPIDVFDRAWGATDYAIAQGILYAVEKGAKVINMSLGGPMRSPLIEEAIKKATEKNIVVIAAAGNTGDDTLNYPAAYEGVISVGSINKEKQLSDFSNYGTSVDIVAPGDEVYSTIYEYERKSSYRKMSGTSMSSPMVAGVASLLLSKYPKLTPVQVEYILEHTAEDLGDKGFDIKFGNGMVNPVAALQFDIKKLPAMTKGTRTEKEILDKAETVPLTEKIDLKGSITKPFEEKWYKAEVRKGELVQFILEGAPQYDYKLMVHLYSPDGKTVLDINKVREGKTEGKLFEAPFTGTLAFGVKDANGSFDDSRRALSKYKLSVEKVSEQPKDETNFSNPIKIELPYKSNEGFTLVGKDADDDFYKFSVKEQQVIKVDLSALPGVDTSISVYMADQFLPPDDPELTEEKKKAILEEMLYGKHPIEPAFYSNKAGKSEGETLTFMAMPEMEYMIKISNKVDNFFGMYDFFINFDMLEEEQVSESSLVPYEFKVEGKVIPPDEDMFPILNKEGADAEKQLDKQREAIVESGKPEEEIDYVEMIKNGSRPYGIGNEASGYLQMFEDEDWFAVTPQETGIYEFVLSKNEASIPMMEIYKIQEEKDRNGKTVKFLNPIGSNVNWGWFDVQIAEKLITGLKKNETYYIKVNVEQLNGNISFDPYKFHSKLILKNPQDKHEDNDSLENIKNLPGSAFEGNFSMPNDQDVFYFESKKSQVYGVTIGQKAVDQKWKSKYPKELISPVFGMAVVFEDVNKNRKLDEKEYDRIQYIDRGISSGTAFGSFKAEKNKNYILIIYGYVDGLLPLSLLPYKFALGPVNQNDEDKGSAVKNNIPSKPLKLKKINSRQWKAAGYLNAGVPYGDEDWYELKLDKDMKGKIELAAGVEVDGIVSLYKNGKHIATSDFYPEGDGEVLYVHLKKGTYHIKVRDTFGNTTLTPYTLNIQFQ
ncbi:peptidase S8 and S53 subtilisin kexin sedolisin [Bacillus methanolicus PB1]|uniref:Peptidase S8 and S53 subtilisin kexin sedolisin n=1 Tax=Bacillus methanolicus PB1 TaxID=997296 RepID=I3E1V0_BACMT|nr:S8 family peptidase [Bacillus methanolicus]EIJ80471.1 peptidase S8 and S53 subtilisin kexin sedolisin [Bacillus methanolicus PB1]